MISEKNVVIIAITALILGAVVVGLSPKDLWDENEGLLKDEVQSIEGSTETINLLDITPFEWDVVHSFTPYTPVEDVYERVGYEWDDTISETVSEGMYQIVFMKDEKVVCYIYGYPENNGYGIDLLASMLTAEDDLTFLVERREGIVYLVNDGRTFD
ncbi:hypothetical protein [Bacillus suaedae]|uniref:DUF4830 domain-containing protein n=1 Tax=Halalkalibacter suaedae TaxID=2822140 RepID=A0A940X0M7_9BACI|nr:hypothetical protein [Bacillus suaedae]MBP3952986.1 hypothetical protein [Bacillus suaedae]